MFHIRSKLILFMDASTTIKVVTKVKVNEKILFITHYYEVIIILSS